MNINVAGLDMQQWAWGPSGPHQEPVPVCSEAPEARRNWWRTIQREETLIRTCWGWGICPLLCPEPLWPPGEVWGTLAEQCF